ncbi:hypothetical protein ANO11243_066610 [Dothideomycetidae sp. 11243]|nr:hypothetical protein ANO11243_066610 [fungal sp. No.11243]
MTSSQALPKGSRILVTGANGFIASHIADQLLKLGYVVRGTARDEKKLEQIRETLLSRHPDGHFEGAVVPSFSDVSAVTAAVKGIDSIIHTAADVSMNTDPNLVVPHSVEGVQTLLKAATSVPSIKSFVLTSSSISAVKPDPGNTSIIDQSSWNDEDMKLAWAPPPYSPERIFSVYAAGKYATEKACWEFVAQHKPHFTFNAVLPNFTTGPILASWQNASTAGWLMGLWTGHEGGTGVMLNFPPQWFVDVRDTALDHIAAAIFTDINKQRFFSFAEPFNYSRAVGIFKSIDPSKTFPPAPENEGEDKFRVQNGPAEELLKRLGRSGFITFEQSIRDQIELSVPHTAGPRSFGA